MSSCPYALGCTRATMVGTTSRETARSNQSLKTGPSWDCSLQLDYMNVESLVIANQQVAVNTFPGLVHTAVTPRKLVAFEAYELTFGRQ